MFRSAKRPVLSLRSEHHLPEAVRLHARQNRCSIQLLYTVRLTPFAGPACWTSGGRAHLRHMKIRWNVASGRVDFDIRFAQAYAADRPGLALPKISKKPLVNVVGVVRFSRERGSLERNWQWRRMKRYFENENRSSGVFATRVACVGRGVAMGSLVRRGECEGSEKAIQDGSGQCGSYASTGCPAGRGGYRFSADIVKGVKTRAIKGDYTPSEVFALMLRDSTLVAVKHRKSGVYLIKNKNRPMLIEWQIILIKCSTGILPVRKQAGSLPYFL